MPLWHRLIVVGVVLAVTGIAAKLIDRAIARRELRAEAATRYRVLRRSVMSAIVFVGALSALLVIPQVRAVAGGILASSAVLGIVIGFASQRTIGNFIAGLLIAITQPLRLGDTVEVDGVTGVVEEIGLTYTFIRTPENVRLVIPNEKLASDTIRNSTIRSAETVAEVTIQVPLDNELGEVMAVLREAAAGQRDVDVRVAELAGGVTLVLTAVAPDPPAAERLASELRLRAHESLRAAGAFG
jgi:small conductance mechanosensitive channel